MAQRPRGPPGSSILGSGRLTGLCCVCCWHCIAALAGSRGDCAAGVEAGAPGSGHAGRGLVRTSVDCSVGRYFALLPFAGTRAGCVSLLARCLARQRPPLRWLLNHTADGSRRQATAARPTTPRLAPRQTTTQESRRAGPVAPGDPRHVTRHPHPVLAQPREPRTAPPPRRAPTARISVVLLPAAALPAGWYLATSMPLQSTANIMKHCLKACRRNARRNLLGVVILSSSQPGIGAIKIL